MPDDKSNVKRAVSMLGWALPFIIMDVSVESWNVLPDAVGYLICLRYLDDLEVLYPGILRIRPLCMILAAVSAADWFLHIQIPVLTLVMTLLQIYVVHAVLTAAAAYGERHKPKAGEMLSRLRNSMTVLQVLLFAFLYYVEQNGILMFTLWAAYVLVLFLLEIWIAAAVAEPEPESTG